jgi:hypothetical protein
MKISKYTAALLGSIVLTISQSAFSFGLLGHILAYSTAGVVTHEVEKSIDNHEKKSTYNSNNTQSNGPYDLVAPISQAEPDPNFTPGAVNLDVNQNNINDTICRRGGYTSSIRPPESYTHQLKVNGIQQYGYSDTKLSHYEEDHLVSLEIGGSPNDPKNLWPQPHHVIGGWGSYTKDKLENRLHELICNGQLGLIQAQNEEAHDWIAAYKKYVGPTPNNE